MARSALPSYSSRFSPKVFTQPSRLSSGFAILVLRQFFKTDYRGVVQVLHDFSDLCRVLGLKKVPPYSTLCYAEQRLVKKGLSIASWPLARWACVEPG
ncbi:MAG: hypothetical protein WBC59_01080 [Phycisphaerae bacterium]